MPTREEAYLMNFGPPPGYGGGYAPSRGYGTLQSLLMERGRLQAEAAQRSGDIWGNALTNFGQTLAGGIQQHQEQKKKKTRDDAYLALMNDPKALEDPVYAHQQFLKIGGPEDGTRMFQAYAGGLQLLQPNRDPEKDQKGAAAAINGLRGLKPENRAQVWERLSAPAGKVFGSQLPQQYDDKFFNDVLVPWADSLKPKEQPIKLGKDERLLEPGTFKPLAEPLPEAPRAETRSLDVQAAEAAARGDTETYNRLLKVKKEMGQADDRPRITVNTGAGLSPVAESNIINRLSNQWTKAVAPVVEMDRQSKLMKMGLEAARRGDMAAGSQAVLVTFQKILDPTSVVRESEYARSAAGQALFSRIEGAYDKLVKGGAGVPLTELEKFAKLADEMVQASMSGHVGAIKKRIGATADRYKIPHETVFEDFSFGGGGSAPAAPAGGPARPQSKAEYDKLPPGTPYLAPDGSLRRKP